MIKPRVPFLGVGLEWDYRLSAEILPRLDRFDCLEIIPENFLSVHRLRHQAVLANVRRHQIPVIGHGVELSIGSPEPLKQTHLDAVKTVLDSVNTICFSDHLCFTEAGQVPVGQLTPLFWSLECADMVSMKIEQIQRQLPFPFLIENISNRFAYPMTEISEVEFINRIVRNTGVGLILDVTNVFTNATNYGFDPYGWIDALEVGTVQQIHLAGGRYDSDGVLEDSHSHSVFDEVWDLYAHALLRTGRVNTIIERTSNFPVFDDLLAEIEKSRRYLRAESEVAA